MAAPLARPLSLRRERDHERTPSLVSRLDPDPAAVRLHDLLGDGEAQPGTSAVAPTGGLHAEEALEDPAPHRARDPGAGVLDREARLVSVPPCGDAHHASRAGEADRVADEVREHLFDPLRVHGYRDRLSLELEADLRRLR